MGKVYTTNIINQYSQKANIMWKFIDESLMKFNVCFSRVAAFRWFVTIVVGLMVCTEHMGVTSIIRALGINPIFYPSMLHFFRASSWTLESVQRVWVGIVAASVQGYKVNDMLVLVGDGIKVSKEGRKMPGVKKLHQESGNSAKPEYIHGHMFGAIGMLINNGEKFFCNLLSMRIHNGNEVVGKWAGDKYAEESHVVRIVREAFGVALQIGKKCILVLDSYYLSEPALSLLAELVLESGNALLTIVTKAKKSVVAWEKPSVRKGRGAPQKRGEKIKLWSLFTSETAVFTKVKVSLYGKMQEVEYLVKDLLWSEGDYFKLRFVLVKWDTSQVILVCNNVLLTPERIIELYGLRFKIECSFRAFKQVVAGFAYRFWTSVMPKLNLFAKNDIFREAVEAVTDKKMQARIVSAFVATERFVLIAIIVLGILQMAALSFGKEIYESAFFWMRTKRDDTPSEAVTANFMRKTIFQSFYFSPNLNISRIIQTRLLERSADDDIPTA